MTTISISRSMGASAASSSSAAATVVAPSRKTDRKRSFWSVDRRDITEIKKVYQQTLARLIKKGSDYHAGNRAGDGALYYAASQRDIGAMQLLISAGAQVNAYERLSQKDSLAQAICRGDVRVAKVLIDAGADLEGGNYSCYSALKETASHGRVEITKLLLEAGAQPDGRFWESPLYHAARGGQYEIVRLLLEAGATVNYGGYFGHTPLCEAVKIRRLDIVDLLLKAGAKVETEKCSALRHVNALYVRADPRNGPLENEIKIAERLLDEGAKPDLETDKTMTLLMWAISQGHDELSRRLIARGDLDLNALPRFFSDYDNRGFSALHWAVQRGDAKLVQELLEAGAELDKKSETQEYTPLMVAIFQIGYRHRPGCSPYPIDDEWLEKMAKLIGIFFEAGSDINASSVVGHTPLMLASQLPNYDLVKTLLKRGADVKACDERGESALLKAARQGCSRTVKLLLHAGAEKLTEEQIASLDKPDPALIEMLSAYPPRLSLKNLVINQIYSTQTPVPAWYPPLLLART